MVESTISGEHKEHADTDNRAKCCTGSWTSHIGMNMISHSKMHVFYCQSTDKCGWARCVGTEKENNFLLLEVRFDKLQKKNGQERRMSQKKWVCKGASVIACVGTRRSKSPLGFFFDRTTTHLPVALYLHHIVTNSIT